ncbi:MAG: hypothetical protein HYZ11_07075 [Candidatus Tectomicrobia bacterium]|uniref:Uncharacterized protein n=1 Tax=Tectimicrobiota bacterium TaxID=2528274 RepID=A0A932HX62_UNCTE|nr:hypothetical protein [Candidatus Tectomicrobia bacterium]
MERLQKVRNFKPYLMRYIHSHDPNYEPVLRDLLDHEHEIYDEMTKERKVLERGKRQRDSWEVVFSELSQILTPLQIQQLFAGLERDFRSTCQMIHEMAESQMLLDQEIGGPGG